MNKHVFRGAARSSQDVIALVETYQKPRQNFSDAEDTKEEDVVAVVFPVARRRADAPN